MDPSASPADEAWLAGGDLVDVIRATGFRDGWTEDEVLRAQAKVRSASARKRAPDWLHCLERATEWVDVAPFPSPVAEARMPSWAKDFLLARVSRAPSSSRLEWAQTRRPSGGPAPGTPPQAAPGVGGLKRKRERGGSSHDSPDVPAASTRVGLRVRGAASVGPMDGGVSAPHLRVKSESPSYSPISGEDSVATGHSGEEDDDDGTYLCPRWAIKHRPPHLVYTSAYQGDDLTGVFWADASPGERVAMRVVPGLADTAVDSSAEDDEGATPSPGAASSRCDAPAQRGSDSVGFRLRLEAGDAGPTSLAPASLGGRLRPFLETPMGLRETARYGLRVLRIGEASPPGPPEDSGGDLGRFRYAAAVAERVTQIDEMVAGMRAEYQTLQAERFALVGAHASGGPTGTAPPGPPRTARRSRTPSSSSPGSGGAPPSSDGGGTSHGTSHTTTSSFFARIRGLWGWYRRGARHPPSCLWHG